MLAPGQWTVTAVLRVMGLSDEPQFQNYHRVLNRAKWSGLQVSQILVGLLVAACVTASSPLVIAADETLERRWGNKIKQKGVFRAVIRSSKPHRGTSVGLRWVSLLLLVSVP